MNNYSSSNYESGQSTHVFTSFPDSHEGQNVNRFKKIFKHFLSL
jgi:hypothetical protein